jgi:hypothetical protein
MAERFSETPAQRSERLKKAKNPWECLEELRRFAVQGDAAVPDEWRAMYLRWWKVYPQGDGEGALGGRGGGERSTRYFMLRIRVPNGLLFSHQLRDDVGHCRGVRPRPGPYQRPAQFSTALDHGGGAAAHLRTSMALPADDDVDLQRRYPEHHGPSAGGPVRRWKQRSATRRRAVQLLNRKAALSVVPRLSKWTTIVMVLSHRQTKKEELCPSISIPKY